MRSYQAEEIQLNNYLESGEGDHLLSQKSLNPTPEPKSPRVRAVTTVLVTATVLLALGFYRRDVSSYIDSVRDDYDDNNSNNNDTSESITVAYLGNSMFYFNDFPRFLQALSGHNMEQNSCLHGGASIPSLVKDGNGMYPQFQTQEAWIRDWHNKPIYDYGACTAEHLVIGYDVSLYDPSYLIHDPNATSTIRNPCHEDDTFRDYVLQQEKNMKGRPHWDFVMINDNTKNPSQLHTREAALETLRTHYVPWLRATGATPVFLWTHAYDIEAAVPGFNDTSDLSDIATFTSLTGVGYRAYVELLEQNLPAKQKPRIAPVGLAFLTIYEENPEFWKRLFHSDHLHASPSGTFLQGCIVHHTLTGRLPSMHTIRHDEDIKALWNRARMMQHYWEPPNPFPTLEDVKYLYSVAERVVKGHVPASYIHYQNGEAAAAGGPPRQQQQPPVAPGPDGQRA